MSLQLHHLHTDGPKPLYKKITADEYDRLNSRIAELERMDAEHTLQIAKMNGYINHLEEERRWRKFPDENPEDWETVVVRMSDGFYDIAAYMSNGQGWYFGEGYHKPEDVTHWMPLPKAPEEEK